MKKLVITLTALCSLSTVAWAGRDDYYTGSAGYASELEWKLPNEGGEMYIWGDYMPMLDTYESHDAIWNKDEVRPLITSIRMTNGQTIGAHAFKNCENLTSFAYSPTSGSGLVKIGDYAFSQSAKLASILFSGCNGLRYIGERAFAGTAIKTFTINKPSINPGETILENLGVNYNYCVVGASAFADCPYLSTVYMKDDTPFADTYNNFLNDYAYLVVNSAEAAATYRAAWTEIADRIICLQENITFENEAVKDICISNWDTNGDGELSYEEAFAVTDFGDAFAGNTTITKIDGLEPFVNVTVIGSGAFAGCTALESITIPPHITDIADDAFTGCTSLKEIHFVNKTPFKDSFTIQTNERTHIIVPDDAVSTYDALWTGKSELIIGESHIAFQCPEVKRICVAQNWWNTNRDGELSYAEAGRINSIRDQFVGSKITSFDELKYFGLTSDPSLIDYDNISFAGCTKLTSIYIPSLVSSIPNNAFKGCTSLKKVIIEDCDKPLSLGMWSYNYSYNCLFVDCPLETLYLGRDITCSFHNGPFNGSINNVTIGEFVTKLENNIFFKKAKNVYINNFESWCECDIQRTPIENNTNVFIEGQLVTGEITIPNTVSELKNSTFQGFGKLTSINIPESVTNIGPNAFVDCPNLLSIDIPNSVTTIGDNAFEGCPGLITFESETPTTYNNYSSSAVYVVPDNAVESYQTAWADVAYRIIGKSALGWKEVTCDAQPTTSHLAELIGVGNELNVIKLRIKGTINSYDMMVMRNKMQNLRELDLTDATIVANSYNYGTGVSMDNNFPDFMKGKALINLLLPTSITRIGNNALNDCNKIKTITIPNNVTSIGDNAFRHCDFLSTVNITNESKLGTIGSYAFGDLPRLQSIDLSPATQLTSLGANAFRGSAIKTIALPASLENVGDNAFNYCALLVSYTGGATIGTGAFGNCFALQSVTIEEGATSIGQDAFKNCTALQTVTIEEGATSIGKNAFEGCTALQTVTIEEGVTSIDQYAFTGCTALSSISLPESLTSIATYAFNGCTALKTITLSDALTSLGTYAFNGCTALEKAEIGMGITSVPQYLFSGCTALEEVKLSPKTTTIQSYAFQNCAGLTEFHLPPYLTTIQSDAFSGCTNLKEIYAYMPDVPAIAASTFSNYKTSTLYAPGFLFDAYYYDNGWNQFLEVLKCDLRPGDYEAFYTNKDLYFKEGEERITHDRPIVELGNQGSIIVEGENQEFTTVDMLRGTTRSSLIGDDNIVMNELRVKIEVSANRWYFLCFPYDVTISKCEYPGKYAWRYYDGAIRAADGTGGWQKIEGDVLKAGVGYIFQSDTEGNLIVKFAAPEFGGDRPTALTTHLTTNAANASWNFVGNPYACYYNLVSKDFASPITVWNGTTYVAYRPGDDNYHLQPYEAFFVQKTEDASAINFNAEGRETYSQSVATATAQTRASFQRSITTNRFIVNLTISDNDTAAIDRTRLVMNNKASCNYELACDASKFISEDAAAQIYTLEGSVKMAINERPGQGKVRIGYTAQKAGKLRIEAQRMDSPMELLDTKTNRTFDLAQGAYEFTTEAGTFDNRFVICTSRGADEINNLTAATGVAIGMQEGGLNIGGAADKLVTIYGTNGTLVAEQYGNGYVALPSGIYVVKVDGHSAKMYVK